MTAHELYTRAEDDGSKRFVCSCGWNSRHTFWVSGTLTRPEVEAHAHVAHATQAEADQEFTQEREDNPALARAEAFSFGEID